MESDDEHRAWHHTSVDIANPFAFHVGSNETMSIPPDRE